jgi:hypothetical protein
MEAAPWAVFVFLGLGCPSVSLAVPDLGIRPAPAIVTERWRLGNSFPVEASLTLFVIACLIVVSAAVVLELTDERGLTAVEPIVWHGVLAGLGVWLLLLWTQY